MSFGFKKFIKGLKLVPQSTDTTSEQGDLQSTTDTFLNYNNGTTSSPIVTISHANQGANRLQNKDLDDSSTAIVDSGDTSKKILLNAGGTTATSTTITAAQTANRVLTLPDATDTLTANAATQTLTNKTINAPDNTITNIVDANISASAAIARTKIAAGSINQVVINNGSGILSSEAALAKSRGGTGIDNSSVTFPSSGVIVTETATETLTNKSIDADTNTITNIENADIKAGANIARSKIAAGTANQVVINDGSGNLTSEAALAATRGGTGFSSYSTGDILYADSSTTLAKLPIGADGEALVLNGGLPTWSSSSGYFVSIIQKSANYNVQTTDNMILAQDDGGSFTLTLPQANTINGHIFIFRKIGTTYSNFVTIACFLGDTIEGASSTTINTFGETLQLVSVNSTWHIIDRDIPSTWIADGSLTPSTGFGTLTDPSYQSCRRGDSYKARGYFESGTVSGSTGTAYFDLPSGIVIDTTKLSTTPNIQILGTAISIPSNTQDIYGVDHGNVFYFRTAQTGRVYIAGDVGGSGVLTFPDQPVNQIMGNVQGLTFEFEIPVVGWKG